MLRIDAYRLASKTFPYPLHLGVTEAGTFIGSAIKSSMALGTLLNEGIGDTIRISVNGDPVNEITIVKQLLKCCGLLKGVPNLIACPTCGRTAWDMQPVVDEIEKFLQTVNCNVNVAIMGCAVNGPGEAKHADIAIAGGKKEGLLIKKGVIIEKLPQEEIVERLKQEILAFEEEHKNDMFSLSFELCFVNSNKKEDVLKIHRMSLKQKEKTILNIQFTLNKNNSAYDSIDITSDFVNGQEILDIKAKTNSCD